MLFATHTERQRQRQMPIQSQWERQPKRQVAPLKFAARCALALNQEGSTPKYDQNRHIYQAAGECLPYLCCLKLSLSYSGGFTCCQRLTLYGKFFVRFGEDFDKIRHEIILDQLMDQAILYCFIFNSNFKE